MLISPEATAYWPPGLCAVQPTTETLRRLRLTRSRRERAIHPSQVRLNFLKSEALQPRFGSWCLFQLAIRWRCWWKQQVRSSKFIRMFECCWMVAMMAATLGSSRFLEGMRDSVC